MWWCTTRPETGSAYKTSPSWSTCPFSTTASCLNPGVSSTGRPRRRVKLTSPPFQLSLLSTTAAWTTTKHSAEKPRECINHPMTPVPSQLQPWGRSPQDSRTCFQYHISSSRYRSSHLPCTLRHSCRTLSHGPSHSPSFNWSHRSLRRVRNLTQYQCYNECLEVIPAPSS